MALLLRAGGRLGGLWRGWAEFIGDAVYCAGQAFVARGDEVSGVVRTQFEAHVPVFVPDGGVVVAAFGFGGYGG